MTKIAAVITANYVIIPQIVLRSCSLISKHVSHLYIIGQLGTSHRTGLFHFVRFSVTKKFNSKGLRSHLSCDLARVTRVKVKGHKISVHSLKGPPARAFFLGSKDQGRKDLARCWAFKKVLYTDQFSVLLNLILVLDQACLLNANALKKRQSKARHSTSSIWLSIRFKFSWILTLLLNFRLKYI